MRLYGIVNFDFGDVAIAGKRALGAIGRAQCYKEIVNADETSFGLRTGGGRHGYGDGRNSRLTSAPRPGNEPGLLELFRVRNAGGDGFEIAGNGMASGAGFLEICFAGFCVANDDAGRSHAGSVVAADLEVVDESGDVCDLDWREIKLRHAFAAIADDGADEFAVSIVENKFGAEEIGPTLASTGVGAVAEIAVDTVERLAALERGGIGWRTLGEGAARGSANGFGGRGWGLRVSG